MTKEKERDILETAIARFGAKHQTMKAVEELGELTQVLMKILERDTTVERGITGTSKETVRSLLSDLRSEMADVEICLKQLRILYGNYDSEIEYKLNRLRGNLYAEEI